jgi:hypothetical protein
MICGVHRRLGVGRRGWTGDGTGINFSEKITLHRESTSTENLELKELYETNPKVND